MSAAPSASCLRGNAEIAAPALVARRILYVWDADYPWDVRVEKICRSLTEAGHDVHIVARNRNRRVAREQLEEGTIHRMPVWKFAGRFDATLSFPAFFNPRWVRLLRRTIETIRPDVVIVRDLPLAPVTIAEGRRAGVPVVIDLAEHYPEMIRDIFVSGRQRPLDYIVRNPRVVSAVERHSLARADHVFVVVEEMRARLEQMHVPPGRISVVSNTPTLQASPPTLGTTRGATGPIRLVYLGILELPRGLSELIDSVRLLEARGHNVHLSIVGAGRDEVLLRQQAADIGVLGTSVTFHGFIERSRALELVATADIGMLPHRRSVQVDHTIPNKLFDYMAAALPVVTSDALPLARIVRETGAGVIHESGDPESIADAVERLADAGLRRAAGERGREAIASRYNWQRDAEIMSRALAKVAAAGARVADA